MGVVFLNRTSRQGERGVTGPITGLEYIISPGGTPVSGYDADALLEMTEPPCCGHTLPFDGKVKSFGIHVPSVKQLEEVPEYLWDAEPIVAAEKPKQRKRLRVYEEKEPELEFNIPEFEPALPIFEEEKSEEVNSEV
jgi:hypothetical protein